MYVNELKACNFCKHFRGYGLHWCSGKCTAKNKEIEDGYNGGYLTETENCDWFDDRREGNGRKE